jgi:hypothetical protein
VKTEEAPAPVIEAPAPEEAEAPAPVRKTLRKKVEAPVAAEPVGSRSYRSRCGSRRTGRDRGRSTGTTTVETKPTPGRILRPGGTQIKQLTLTRDALQKGVKPGERVVSEAPTRPENLIRRRWKRAVIRAPRRV